MLEHVLDIIAADGDKRMHCVLAPLTNDTDWTADIAIRALGGAGSYYDPAKPGELSRALERFKDFDVVIHSTRSICSRPAIMDCTDRDKPLLSRLGKFEFSARDPWGVKIALLYGESDFMEFDGGILDEFFDEAPEEWTILASELPEEAYRPNWADKISAWLPRRAGGIRHILSLCDFTLTLDNHDRPCRIWREAAGLGARVERVRVGHKWIEEWIDDALSKRGADKDRIQGNRAQAEREDYKYEFVKLESLFSR